MVSFMLFSTRFFMLIFMAWSLFHVADAGPPAKGGGKGKDKSKDKSKQWEQLVRNMLHDSEPLPEIESLPGDLDPHADTDFEEEDFEERSDSERALHTSEEGVTAADTVRWDAIVATSRPSGTVQTQDAAINTEASSPATPVAVAGLGDRPGRIDPTAGMAQEDRRYLRGLPGMNHFISMIERHDWTTPPDAAFTLACAGLLRDCLQDEGHSTEDIRSFAGAMLQNQQPHPPAAAPVSDADVSDSSTRSRSRTPARSTGRACPPAVMHQLGSCPQLQVLHSLWSQVRRHEESLQLIDFHVSFSSLCWREGWCHVRGTWRTATNRCSPYGSSEVIAHRAT